MSTRVDIGFSARRPYVSGDGHSLEVTIVNDEDGTRQPLSGTLATFSVFDKDPDTGAAANLIFTKSVGSGITITDPQNGVLTVFITDSNTAGLHGDYFYELQLNHQGTIHTALLGTLRIRADAIA